ncbi:MAG: MauE/DoxX family redox-associated membrane protein [Pseudomonadota bacterium]
MTTQTYALEGLHCNACIGRVTKKLEPLAEKVNVTLDPMQVVLENPVADVGALQAAVAAAGKYQMIAPQPSVASPTTSKGWEDEEPKAGWLATYSPLLLIIGYILGAVLLVQLGHGGVKAITVDETMRYFMAGFFLVFSFFKLLDINAFADAYIGYDLLARRWRGWALIYPFVELALGMAYLAHLDGPLLNGITVVVMGFSAIGVIQAVTSKRRIQCACLGAVFKLPMSTVTIVEDLGMVAMALWMMMTMTTT